MIGVSCMIVLVAMLSTFCQEESPSEALAKIQETVMNAKAFSVRVDVGAHPGDLSVKLHVAYARENKFRLDLQMPKESESHSSLLVSDGTTLTSRRNGLCTESKAEAYLGTSWTSALVSSGILPSVLYAIEYGENVEPRVSCMDFRQILTTTDASFGMQEGSLREIKYDILYTQLVDNEKRTLKRYNVSLTYDKITHLPRERTVVDPKDSSKSFYEQYREWLFGNDVKLELFTPPK